MVRLLSLSYYNNKNRFSRRAAPRRRGSHGAPTPAYVYFTQEQQMQIDLDNPLCLDFIPRLELNGKTMLTSHGLSLIHI